MGEVSQTILYGGMSYIPELEVDENEEREVESLEQYIRYEISEAIGTEEFDETFLALGNDLLYQSIDGLKDAYTAMAEKVYEVYEYEHPEDIEISDRTELENYIEFVKFIEYNHIDFLSVIWYELLSDQKELIKLDIGEFCIDNKNEISSLMENETESYVYNHIINTFLLSYPTNMLIKWFADRSIRNRYNIIFNNLTGGNET